MGWCPYVKLIWGWEAEKTTHDRETGQVKYNENTGEAYNVLEHSHETLNVGGKVVFSDTYVYGGEGIDGLECWERGSIDNHGDSCYWGLVVKPAGDLEYGGIDDVIDTDPPQEILDYQEKHDLPPFQLYIVGR